MCKEHESTGGVKWFSVDEKLPPNRTNVLTFRPDHKFHGLDKRCSTHVYYEDYGKSGPFFVGYDNFPVGDETIWITHWAFLPEAPTGQEEPPDD